MGLILDTSILIADERGRFDMPAFLGHGGYELATLNTKEFQRVSGLKVMDASAFLRR